MKATHFAWIDPVSSLVIVALIALGSWKLLRRSFDLAIDAVPDGIDSKAVRAFLESRPGVQVVADLHIWGMSTTETALTAHLVMPEGSDSGFVSDLAHELIHEFGINHSTIQIDQDHGACSLTV